jgi:molybdopterin converting factor small subunit
MLYFAAAKDAAGLASEVIPITNPGPEGTMSISELFGLLEARHPKLADKQILSSACVAVNLEYVDIADGRIKPGDEVAIIPPVSGG